MFCTNCGKEIKEGSNFCPNCGKKISTHKFIPYIVLLVLFILIIAILLIYFLKKDNNNTVGNYSDNSNITEEYNIKELKLRNLDYEILLKQNGNMEVTEIWNIEILDTNTLYKTFTLDPNKFDGITNVKVEEILDKNNTKKFTQIDTEMYQVTQDCYYALINSNGQFEIAWGINTKNKVKTYKITYTIEGAVKLYNDCGELYWMFLGSDFNIPIDNIRGKISTEIESDKEILAWSHSNNYENGTIKKSGKNIVFTMNNFRPKDYFEIRLALPKEMFTMAEHSNIDRLEQIIQEENR